MYICHKQCQSQVKIEEKNQRRGGVKKKTRPQFSILSSVTESAWNQPYWAHADSVTELKIENCGRVFFFDTSSPLNFFFNFHSTLTANNSGLKPSKLKNYHIFGILRTSAFSWYTLVRSYYWKTLRKMRFRFLSFHHK